MQRPLFFRTKTAIFLSIMLIFSVIIAGCGKTGQTSRMASGEVSCERTSYIMHTMVVQKWYGDNAEKACDEIEEALGELEKAVSLYIADSEINKINDAAGEGYVEVSEELFAMLQQAKELCLESEGALDITIGPLALLWDVAGNEGDPHVPAQSDIDEALELVDYTRLLLDEEMCAVMLKTAGMKLDLGAVAKGYAAALMRSIAEENEVSGYLSVGGNMLVIGQNTDGSDFVIGVRDPLKDSNSYFATICIEGYTMATSSAAEIYFEEDGVTYHHILDPSTGYPGDTDLLQVSVISEDGLLADTLSTTIFLLGSECLDEYMNRDDCLVLAVTKDCEVYGSDAVWDMVTPVNTDDYTFIN